ncbi:spore coat U domain-containing protein [Variovorax sp. V59]|jgi:spore coat protein U-like protein|uniref:Spore coat protein U-like protein n=2 Tax=Variovorax TaxID=34072 RepID=A0AAE3Y1V7_VARPD|nr:MULTISPECIES: spore coat U domain-containing protein [Variovorax]MBD9663195.1 spore coat protein U domain-containing protein [Variovorax sp. VRV01]MDR6428127.1 spore coat protein U-like protein [Variovorax paradoxus]TWD86086.1 spore coat protein U-like protein [Variovorax beijingensis]
MKKLSLIVAATLAVTTSAVLAATSPATATFQVLITVAKACSVVAGAGSKIDFGTVDSSATNLSGNSNISVTCSKTTPYNIGLLPSNNSTTGAGVMSPATGSDTVAYQLRSVSATGAVWGSTATSTAVGNGVAGTGTGAAQTIPVYATVASANVTPGAYSDTVTVQVNY